MTEVNQFVDWHIAMACQSSLCGSNGPDLLRRARRLVHKMGVITSNSIDKQTGEHVHTEYLTHSEVHYTGNWMLLQCTPPHSAISLAI